MAKKIFQKSELLELYENRNYKRVISKIKQFKIEGMSEKEIDTINLKSYLKLIEVEFKDGDIQRAIRNVDIVLKIKESDKHKLMKLKYLCYLEHFDMAVEFAKPLLTSRYKLIKQNASFLYSLAKVYNGNFEIEESVLNNIELNKKSYLFGFIELKKGDKNRALEWFEKINLEKRSEVNNLEILKKIILNEDIQTTKIDKKLYNALILGKNNLLLNSKNGRIAKKEMEKNFNNFSKQNKIKHFFENKGFISINLIDEFFKENKDEHIKAIYNNIALMCEKGDYESAFSIFLEFRDELIKLPESINIFLKIIRNIEFAQISKVFMVCENYLQFHKKRLPEFQQSEILNELFKFTLKGKEDDLKNFVLIVKKYDILPINYALSLFCTSSILGLNSHIEILKDFFRKKSLLSSKKFISFFNKFKDNSIDLFKNLSNAEMKKKLSLIIKSIDETLGDYKKFQDEIWILLSSISFLLLQYDFKQNKENYLLLEKIIKFYRDNFDLKSKDLPKECNDIFSAIKNKKSPKKRENNNSISAMFEDMLDNIEIFDDEYDIWEEEGYNDRFEDYELELDEFREDFYAASENEYNDLLERFADIHLEYQYPVYKQSAYRVALDMINSYYINGKKLSFEFFTEFFDKIKLPIKMKELRDEIPIVLEDYGVEIEVKIAFIKYAMDNFSNAENAWYLKWIYAYIKFCRTHSIKINKIYYNRFIKIYEKKLFTTLQSQYLELVELEDEI